MLKKMLERRWRAIAPKKLIREVDDAVAAKPVKRAAVKPSKKMKL
jgi:hypothetical protein